MLTPIPRSPTTNIQSGSLAHGPTTLQPCNGYPPAKIITNSYSSNSVIPLEWEIFGDHQVQGNCFVELSITEDDTNFISLKQIPDCASSNQKFTQDVPLPSDVSCERCTLRWRLEVESTKESFIDCADISILANSEENGEITQKVDITKKENIDRHSQ
ncbi:hypothetical protein G9A89_004575 [Geosiphon pyriformis]|nr:hypothetical protein G9A89_004575 [Geosiphon pyriformis]